jgi:hypothetical protein
MNQPDSLVHEVRLRTQHIDSNELLQAMGYPGPSLQNVERLQSVLSSSVLGLDQSAFDFRYSGEEFVLSLSKALGLRRSFAQRGIAVIKSVIEREASRFKPYLFVDTGFKRNNQPLFVLAFLEHQRHVPVLDIQFDTPIAQQIELAGRYVREHYAQSRGDLGTWGTIQRYLFYYAQKQAVALSLQGVLVGEWQGPEPSKAVFNVLKVCGGYEE